MTDTTKMSTNARKTTRNTSTKSQRSKISHKSEFDETNMDVSQTMAVDETTMPPTDTMKVTAEVSADLAEMDDMLDSVTKTPVPSSNRKVLRTVLTTQDTKNNTPTQAEKDKKDQDTEKESQVLWVDPQEEVDRKKLADQLNA